MKKKKQTSKKQQKKKIILASLAVGAAGILGYFGWQYVKKKKGDNASELDMALKAEDKAGSPLPTPQARPSTTPKKVIPSTRPRGNALFPLKPGSRGEKVKLLQEALIAKYGKSALPKSGADGIFGAEMVSALKKLKLPLVINESTFNVLTAGKTVNPVKVGTELYKAVSASDFTKAVALLKNLNNTAEYQAANETFKANRIGGVRQTIVNGLLNSFTDEKQKEQIKFEFLRMGLQFDGNTWSLSGFGGAPVLTTEPAIVWVNAVQGVKVPARMVLGNEVSKRLDYTLFENNGKYFLVQTRSIKPV